MIDTTAERAKLTQAVTDGNGQLLPHFRTFSAVYNMASMLYSSRWDEAVRHGWQTAQAMRRDAYFKSMEQERISPLSRWKWEIVADESDQIRNPKDPQSVAREQVRKQLETIVRKTYELHQMRNYLGYSLWFGRYGSQVRWDQTLIGGYRRWVVGYADPVDGDKIHFDYAGTPGVMVQPGTKIPDGTIKTFDAFGPVLMLDRPAFRQKFIVSKHHVEDASFQDPLAAGRRHGVGLRDYVYWAWWLRDEMLSWLMDFMEKVGSLGLVLVYYKSGNAKAKEQAEATARDMRGKNAIAVPRSADDDGPAVELVTPQMAGVGFLKEVVVDIFESHIERLFVGQTLSASSEGNGLGGSGVAGMHTNTKHNLLTWDAENQAGILTTDLVAVAKFLNFREAPWNYSWQYRLPDPESKEKLEGVERGVKLGLKFKASEVRALIGLTAPDDDDETVGGQEQPAGPQGPGGMPGGGAPEQTDSPLSEFLNFGSESQAVHYEAKWTQGSDEEGVFWKSEGGLVRRADPTHGSDAKGATESQAAGKATSGGQPSETETAAAVEPQSRMSQALGYAKRGKEQVARAVQYLKGTGLARFLFAVEHKVMITAHKTRDICEEAAKNRGMTEEQSARLKSTLATADLVAGWVGGGVLAVAVNPVASKIGYLPTVSAVYLAYSAARNPMATLKAAKKVVMASSLNPVTAVKDVVAQTRGDAVHHAHGEWLRYYAAESGRLQLPGWAERLADLLAVDDVEVAEYHQAVFLVALAASEDPESAVDLVEQVATQSQNLPVDPMQANVLVEAMVAALEAGDEDTYERLADLAADPEQLAAVFGGSVDYSSSGRLFHYEWVEHGQSSSGKPRWKNTETGKVRYQTAKPGTRGERKQKADATLAKETLEPIRSGQASPEQLQQFAENIGALTKPELRQLREELGAKFGRSDPKRAEMVSRLREFLSNPENLKPKEGKPATRPDGTPVDPKPRDVHTVDPKRLKVDPKRFQYKVSNIGADGVSDELKGTSTWNPELGGTLLVWRDPENGQDYVINGHHRHELAQRTGAESVNVRYIESPNAKTARAKGALANIAEGRGTATDAAKYLRDSGQDIEHLKRAGISMSGKVASDASQLADLSDKAFQRLTNGLMDEQKAVAVAKHLKDHTLQDALFRKLEAREEDGKDWSQKEIETAAKKLARAGSVTKTESTLFGELENEESTFDQEVEIETYIGRELNKVLSDYVATSSQQRANRLEGTGNVLAVEENRAKRKELEMLVEDFQRETQFKSAVGDTIRESAITLAKAKSKKEKEDAKREALDKVRRILEAGPGKPAQADAGRSGTSGSVEPGAAEGAEPINPDQMELFASGEGLHYAAEWTQGSDEKGPYWKSQGGAVRRTDPRSRKEPDSTSTGSQQGQSDEPKRAKISKQTRTESMAFLLAVATQPDLFDPSETGRAIGELRNLTRDQARQLAKELKTKTSGLKDEVVQRVAEAIKRTVETAERWTFPPLNVIESGLPTPPENAPAAIKSAMVDPKVLQVYKSISAKSDHRKAVMQQIEAGEQRVTELRERRLKATTFEAYTRLSSAINEAEDKVQEAYSRRQRDDVEASRQLLAEAMGGKSKFSLEMVNVKGKLKPEVASQIEESQAWLNSMLPGFGRATVKVHALPPGGRAHAKVAQQLEIAMPAEFFTQGLEQSVYIHEVAHHMERDPDIRAASNEFLKYRLGDEKPEKFKKLFPNYGFTDEEEGAKDQFDLAFDKKDAYYVGKSYKGGFTEVLSMGLQKLYDDPVTFAANDPEYFAFVVHAAQKAKNL